ncbi:capsid protein [Aliivibrio fischeri]|uniref:GPO family capsid scaffolding protein n=1 Tax=Aliivibrio fischeri TaxID=668 RepID=UPI0012DA8E2E|nr:GPO family capsid scaffolding protein [Aliivibrio fischeri]MUK40987.1 capsid protein [Aliivibrio fischeri]
MPQLQTDWIRIATAGNAIDGRVIDEKMLNEMAELYNPDEYTARIWPDHRRWFGAWGDVVALKTEEWNGKIRLFAKLRPNSQLMQANESDQKTFCSIEIDVKDFDGTGKHYLGALGVTDEPGSLGTEKLKFNAKNKGAIYSEAEPFLIESVADVDKPTMFRKVMNLFSANDLHVEEDTVKKEQFEQLMSGIQGIADKQETLETRFASFEDKSKDDEKDETPNADENKESGISDDQFSSLMSAVQDIQEKQGDLSTRFNKLEQEAPNQRPNVDGDETYQPL